MEKYGCNDLLYAIKRRLNFESTAQHPRLLFSYEEDPFKKTILSAEIKEKEAYFPVPANEIKVYTPKGTQIKNILIPSEQLEITIIFSNARVRPCKRGFTTRIHDQLTNKSLKETLVSKVQSDEKVVSLMQCSHSDFSLIGIVKFQSDSRPIMERPLIIIPGVVDYAPLQEFENRNAFYYK